MIGSPVLRRSSPPSARSPPQIRVAGIAPRLYYLLRECGRRTPNDGQTIASPYQIPAGVVTAFIGAPYFLWLLSTRRGG
ncbi:MAG: iron chelate uptake ABC transporter family permease subunit [Phycisphaeraceae bacterium]